MFWIIDVACTTQLDIQAVYHPQGQTLLTLGFFAGQQGGKNRRRGKNENDNEKRELIFKEDGQGWSPLDLELLE
jgi:hypothetical protein